MRVHTGEKPYECDKCDYKTSDCSTLARHMRVHTGEKPHTCTWAGCNYATARSGDLARHKRMHTGEKPHKCAHEKCEYAASRTSHLAEHYRIHHVGAPIPPLAGGNKRPYASSAAAAAPARPRVRKAAKTAKRSEVKLSEEASYMALSALTSACAAAPLHSAAVNTESASAAQATSWATSQADAQAAAARSSAAAPEAGEDSKLFELPSDLVVVEECESPPLSPVPAPINNEVEAITLGPISPKAKSPMRHASFAAENGMASPARKQMQTLSDAERAVTMALATSMGCF